MGVGAESAAAAGVAQAACEEAVIGAETVVYPVRVAVTVVVADTPRFRAVTVTWPELSTDTEPVVAAAV